MKEMHFEGFRVRSRSSQELEISFKASKWPLEDDEMMVRSSANPLTLCGLERLTEEVPVMSLCGKTICCYHTLSATLAPLVWSLRWDSLCGIWGKWIHLPQWRSLWQGTTLQVRQSLVHPIKHRCKSWYWASPLRQAWGSLKSVETIGRGL